MRAPLRSSLILRSAEDAGLPCDPEVFVRLQLLHRMGLEARAGEFSARRESTARYADAPLGLAHRWPDRRAAASRRWRRMSSEEDPPAVLPAEKSPSIRRTTFARSSDRRDRQFDAVRLRPCGPMTTSDSPEAISERLSNGTMPSRRLLAQRVGRNVRPVDRGRYVRLECSRTGPATNGAADDRLCSLELELVRLESSS